ncbi:MULTISPECIES: DUF4124 domain-containing protein [Marinobacter]|uniref:DUF4124 domain-containing protein n=1 Tax=Marinobacter segnicrescens TaxID=430453 RepID=A0A1I0DUB0_9GAMM|nr:MULTISPECIES: DUF4124 domain-containing protein [Marinobacter]UZD66621.1 DUF4124 domain-containing protein [Marinobacter sp. AN1]SET36241.1 protein of unknown function [Marinobacter segnicrescens]
MKAQFLIAAVATAFLSLPAQAEVYRQVDKDGNVTFTDDPQGKAERLDVKPVTTITMPKPETVRKQMKEDDGEIGDQDAYDSVTFLAPNDDEAFHSGSGNVQFQVASDPALRRGHRFEITLDGQPVGQTSSGTVSVSNVFRGTHKAGVNVINAEGERVFTGDSITFTIHRPSVLN